MREGRGYLVVLTALMVVLIAVLAGTALWTMRRVHAQVAHASATRSVIEQGQSLLDRLVVQPVVQGDEEGGMDWSHFSRQVELLRGMEGGLQYVSVIKDGVTVFHEQTRLLEGPAEQDAGGRPAPPDPPRMYRKLLRVGGEEIPVVVFRSTFQSKDGKGTVLEVAVSKETVSREEGAAARAIASLFRVSIMTILASFGVCVLVVVWMMRREIAREAQRREEEHLAFAGMLANGIVHDFRNPMSSIRLDAQLLAREAGRESGQRLTRMAELAERIRSTTDRLDKVFQEFLFMSKPPADKRERIDLGRCVNECVDMVRPRLDQAEVKVEVQGASAGVEVEAFESSIRRALMNVITNAEGFSKAGHMIRVVVGSTAQEAWVDVLDEGPGVPEADRRRIFDMFVTTRPGGTGLGLFLAKAAVERCGGHIGVTNRPEGGACFRLSFPLVPGRKEEEAAP